MKKSHFILSTFLMFSLLLPQLSQATNPESEAVVQKSLETKQLEKILETDEAGNLLPIQLVSNGLVDKGAKFRRDGKKISVFDSSDSQGINAELKFLELKSMKIKKNKSILKFDYAGKKVRISLKKLEGDWNYRSIYIKKGKGSYYLDVTT
ncbi:MAG: hypothetical protein AAGD28_03185 [Bacteroidota bacterium]